MSRRYDAVLFDWDDTLCGAEPHRFVYAQQVAARLGVDLTMPEVYQAFVRAGDSTLVSWQTNPYLLPEALGIDPQRHEEFSALFRERDMIKRFTLFDDVLAIVGGLGERDLRTGILSNNDDVARLMAELDIHHHFEVIVSPQTFGVGKPEPEIFLRTMELLDLPPERAIYVGDSYDNDVIGARAAGLTPVLIDRFLINLDSHDTEHRVETLHDLAALLDRLIHS
ncbi:MAG TPA: HAD family hydrolase [Thermomicrobiales bacterium]|nr:HAD family hydrolase [Thermomicrobiales bacterium]